MTIQQIVGFCELAKYNNFSQAAQRIFLTPSAFSRMISSLEEELNCKLFDRSKANPRLTETGEDLLSHMLTIRDSYEQMLSIAQNSYSGKNNIIFAVFLYGIVDVMRDHLSKFLQVNPHSRIDITEYTGSSVFSALAEGKADFVYTIYIPKKYERELNTLKITEYQQCAYLPLFHPLAQQKSISMSQLQSEKFIIFNRSHYPLMYSKFNDMCTNAGFIPHIVDESDSFSLIFGQVMCGKGILITPGYYREYPGLAVVPIEGSEPDPGCLIWSKNNKKISVRTFVQFVQSEMM